MSQDRKSLIDIDEEALDQEWLKQPGLTLNYGEEKAQAVYEYSQAKANFELTEAQLSLGARQTPSEFGLPDKPTVDAIKAAVTCHKDYQNTQTLMFMAKLKVDKLTAAVSACENRKKALEDLVQLKYLGFHSEPSTSKLSPADREAARKNSRRSAFVPLREDD